MAKTLRRAVLPLESELFGYEEGSFTGAKRGGKKGRVELANAGTLFLDEIGDMPLVMQAKILRDPQEGESEHVGGGKPIPVDVRIIAATNKKLENEVAEGCFRADLNEKYHTEVYITPEARKQFRQSSWPSNVRELKNVVYRCYAIRESGVITSMSRPREITDVAASGDGICVGHINPIDPHRTCIGQDKGVNHF